MERIERVSFHSFAFVVDAQAGGDSQPNFRGERKGLLYCATS